MSATRFNARQVYKTSFSTINRRPFKVVRVSGNPKDILAIIGSMYWFSWQVDYQALYLQERIEGGMVWYGICYQAQRGVTATIFRRAIAYHQRKGMELMLERA